MIARGAACAVVAIGLLAAIWLERARARAAELAQQTGPVLLAYAGAARDEGQRTLVVNGAELELRTGRTEDTIDTVLTQQEHACGAAHRAPVIRLQSADQGVLGCLVAPDDSTLLERLRALARMGELAALGELRITWVLQSEGQRRYAVIATDDPSDIMRMFPEHGDAPGFDAPGVPRPPEGRRVLSVSQPGTEPAIVAYLSPLPLRALAHRYARALADRSVERVDLERGTDATATTALLVRGTDAEQLVLLESAEGGTITVIIPLPHATARASGR